MTLSPKTIADAVPAFLASKTLSANSKQSYYYDLKQFLELTKSDLSLTKFRLYEQFLAGQKPSASRRKASAVNQFLWYLYEQQLLDRAYRLQVSSGPATPSTTPQLLDKSLLYQKSDYDKGQCVALLIVELGLTPAEIAELTVEQFDFEFKVVKLTKNNRLRILPLAEQLLGYLKPEWSGKTGLVFSHAGTPYSRQWFFNQLNHFLASIGLADETAKSLRVQYILQEKAAGKSASQISRQLGLKSPVTLEKYF